MQVSSWTVEAPGQPMVLRDREETPAAGQALVQVEGCGVCHTDLGYYYDGIPTRHPLPLTLGHEVSGTVVEAGEGAKGWIGSNVVVPAVIPCGHCPTCHAGRGSICPEQVFPGNDVHGGFGTHLVVPARGLCHVPDLSDEKINPNGLALSDLAVIADAISTPFQAIVRSKLGPGDLAVFVGVGGVGGFGVQLAAARGARVIAIDVDEQKLAIMSNHGASLTLNAKTLEFKEIKAHVKAFARKYEIPSFHYRIFETSGTPQGQTTAFGLIGHGSYLSFVGFAPQKVEVRLSNLMAFDAQAEGNWGCLPEHYPSVLELVLEGEIELEPFIESRPLSSINDTFADVYARKTAKRIILIPERH